MIRSNNIQMKIGDLLARHMAAANLLGRSQIAREVYRKTGKVIPIATTSRHHSGKRHFIRFDEADDELDEVILGLLLKLSSYYSAEYLRSLTPVTKETFDGMTAQRQRIAFTVAGVSDVRIIQKVRDELADVIQKGVSPADFETAAKKITSDAGATDALGFGSSQKSQAYGTAEYLRKLEPVTKDTFEGLTTERKRDAFTVDGVSDVRVVQKVRDELAEAMQKGGSAADLDSAVKKISGDVRVADELSIGFSLKLPADGSANYLRNLTPVTRDTFDGLTTQYKRDAFTVAGVSDVRIIQKVRDELADVMQKGGTRADFEAAVKKITGDAGVADITAFTLDTVFTTNMQKAYSLGRYEQMTDPDVAEALPFWQYFTVGDDRVRPEHAVLDGFQARVGDPVWNKIYPPNGFNCRCIVIALLASEAGDEASEPGYARLPLLAQLKVPTPGFTKVFAAAT